LLGPKHARSRDRGDRVGRVMEPVRVVEREREQDDEDDPCVHGSATRASG
jgi:hypothetical protein